MYMYNASADADNVCCHCFHPSVTGMGVFEPLCLVEVYRAADLPFGDLILTLSSASLSLASVDNHLDSSVNVLSNLGIVVDN